MITRRRGSSYRIEDTERLARIVDQLVNDLGEGSETTAAPIIGLSQTTLNRLRRQVYAVVSFETARRLEQAAKRVGGEALARELSDAIVSRAAVDMLQEGYRDWCNQRYRRFEALDDRSGEVGRVKTWRVNQQGRVERELDDGRASRLRRAMLGAVRSAAEKEFPKEFAGFRDWWINQKLDNMRFQVAMTRIVEPLAETVLCAYVERRWGELTKEERRDFVKAGIRREKILLKRPHALARARQVVARGVGPASSGK